MNGIATRKYARPIVFSLLIAVCTGFTAYYRSFTHLAFYDDEGTMMLGVERLLNGDALYDQVHSIYGPVYYLYQWCAHALTGIALSHDSVRFVTVFFWVATALLMFFLVWRATGSLLLSVIAHLLVFRGLSFLAEEAAHPQEACIFLLAALGVAAFTQDLTLRMVLLGALAGALTLTKINLGIFVVAALAVGLVFASRPGWLRTLATIAVSCGTVLIPVLLMWGYWDSGWALRYSLLVALSIAAVIVTQPGVKWSAPLTLRELAIAVLAFAGAMLAICGFPLSHGSSAYAIFDWLVIRPRTSFANNWYIAAPIKLAAPFWAAVGLACAWYTNATRVRRWAVPVLKLLLAAVVIVLSAGNRYGAILNVATPFLWLAAVRPEREALGADRDGLARLLLALVAVMQSLYAFPVSGNQLNFTNITMIVIAILCLHDGLDWVVATYPQWFTARLVRSGVVALGVLLALLYVHDFLNSEQMYYTLEPVGLPGASRLRVQPEKAQALRSLVRRATRDCSMLVSEPGLFSFNMWTGKPGLTGLTTGAWMMLTSDVEQQGFAHELSGDPHACVIYREDAYKLWAHGVDVSARPLVRYIQENFHTVFEAGGYRLMVR
jgi:hypothetical protein